MTKNSPVQPVAKPATKADIARYRKGKVVYRAIINPSPKPATKSPTHK